MPRGRSLRSVHSDRQGGRSGRPRDNKAGTAARHTERGICGVLRDTSPLSISSVIVIDAVPAVAVLLHRWSWRTAAIFQLLGRLFHPGMPREPFVFDTTMWAMGAPEENGRAAETGYFGLNACGERTSRHRTLYHYNTHCGSSCERLPPRTAGCPLRKRLKT